MIYEIPDCGTTVALTDVPLREAMIAWNRAPIKFEDEFDLCCPPQPPPGIIVVWQPDHAHRARDYRSSMGACCAGWRQATSRDRLAQLLALAFKIVARDGVPVGQVQKALMGIPEFRKLWNHEFRFC